MLLLGAVVLKAEELNRKKYIKRWNPRPFVIKNNNSTTKSVVQVPNEKVTSSSESCSIIGKVREILDRILAEIDEPSLHCSKHENRECCILIDNTFRSSLHLHLSSLNSSTPNGKHLGNSYGTYLELINDSVTVLTNELSEVENGDSRSDHKFQHAVIEPRSSLKRRQKINVKRNSAMSTMKFSQDGQEAFSIRIDQWAAKSKEEKKQSFDLQNRWKVHLTAGIGRDTLQYRFEKP